MSYQGARRGDYEISLPSTKGIIAAMGRLDSRIENEVDRVERRVQEWAGAVYVLALIAVLVAV